LLLAVASVLVSGAGCSEKTVTTKSAPAPLLGRGEPVPSAEAPEASGEPPPVTLADEAQMQALIAGTQGKILVVNVWATYCIPCIQEMPLLSTFYRGMDRDKVAFLSISADMPYSVDETVKPFVAERNIAFPVAVLNFDDPDPDILAAMLGVSDTGWDGTLPATFVFDRNRDLQAHISQELEPGQLEKLVEPLLATS
jgi:thiol-disulfide isomerase/thioredoxin